MTLLSLVAVLVVVGVCLWGLSRLPMIDGNVKTIIYVIVVVALVLWLATGFLGGEARFNPRLW